MCKLLCEQNGDTVILHDLSKDDAESAQKLHWSLKKKSANEYENYPQKEKLETTNEEWKQN